jgi:hypothetical protein
MLADTTEHLGPSSIWLVTELSEKFLDFVASSGAQGFFNLRSIAGGPQLQGASFSRLLMGHELGRGGTQRLFLSCICCPG